MVLNKLMELPAGKNGPQKLEELPA